MMMLVMLVLTMLTRRVLVVMSVGTVIRFRCGGRMTTIGTDPGKVLITTCRLVCVDEYYMSRVVMQLRIQIVYESFVKLVPSKPR